jgi:hypothetical protein
VLKRVVPAPTIVVMDAPAATAAATTAATTTGTTSSPSTDKAAAKSFATLFADAEKQLHDGEKLTKVEGHPFARIKGGERDDMCVNLSGNARSGQAFDLIWRDGHCFHVYGGKGADHVVVEVGASKKQAAAPESSVGTAAKAQA